MTVSLTSIIADLESKIANADSSSSLSDLLSLLNSAERLTGTKSIYDSSELLTTAAEEGSVKYLNNGSLKLYDGSDWRNINTEYVPPPTQQGSNFGFVTGGHDANVNQTIEKFTFAASTSVTDVGDLLTVTLWHAGTSSTTHGYTAGGYDPAGSTPTDGANKIEKFSFSVDGNSTDVGDLTVGHFARAGIQSQTFGYASGGNTSPGPTAQNVIEKFPYAADANATDVGNLTVARGEAAGSNSSTHGYTTGGHPPPAGLNTIDKFSLSADGNATDVGDLTVTRYGAAGTSSTTHGYSHGGRATNTYQNVIDKHAFATDGNATDVGDLTATINRPAGASSTTHGHSMGGEWYPIYYKTISRYAFASDGNASQIGNLTNRLTQGAGHQN